MDHLTPASRIGVVVIGRNEGERLRAAIGSVADAVAVVYVDSGSTDGSVGLAREMGADTVDLDMSRPFSAARARNAGLARLLEREPRTTLVQFVDGDCEIDPGWLARAAAAMAAEPTLGAVCGRLRERHPDRSIYNRLCDVEWDAPGGVVRSCGGNAMYRVQPLVDAGGFNEAVAAGEEPELCYRLRQRGHIIRRVPDPMALHDADIRRFRDWWRRAARGGGAIAHGMALHGRGPERFNQRRAASVVAWAAVVPVVLVAGLSAAMIAGLMGLGPAFWAPGLGAAIVAAMLYPVLWARIACHHVRLGRGAGLSALVAAFTIIAKFAELAGMLRFWSEQRATRVPTADPAREATTGPTPHGRATASPARPIRHAGPRRPSTETAA